MQTNNQQGKITCYNCGKIIAENDKFCKYCGVRVLGAQFRKTQYHCRFCQNPMEKEDAFCSGCGAPNKLALEVVVPAMERVENAQPFIDPKELGLDNDFAASAPLAPAGKEKQGSTPLSDSAMPDVNRLLEQMSFGGYQPMPLRSAGVDVPPAKAPSTPQAEGTDAQPEAAVSAYSAPTGQAPAQKGFHVPVYPAPAQSAQAAPKAPSAPQAEAVDAQPKAQAFAETGGFARNAAPSVQHGGFQQPEAPQTGAAPVAKAPAGAQSAPFASAKAFSPMQPQETVQPQASGQPRLQKEGFSVRAEQEASFSQMLSNQMPGEERAQPGMPSAEEGAYKAYVPPRASRPAKLNQQTITLTGSDLHKVEEYFKDTGSIDLGRRPKREQEAIDAGHETDGINPLVFPLLLILSLLSIGAYALMCSFGVEDRLCMSIPQMEIMATAIALIAMRKRVYYVISGAVLAVVGYMLSLFTIVYMTLPMGTVNLVPVLWGNALDMLKALPGSMYFYIGMFLCTALLSLFLEETFYTKLWLPAAAGSLLYSGYYVVVNGFDIPKLFLQSPDVLFLPVVAVLLSLVCGLLQQNHMQDEKLVDNLERV